MTEQLEQILQTSDFIKRKFPKNFNPKIAVICESNFGISDEFKKIESIKFSELPFDSGSITESKAKIVFARSGDKDVLLLEGRLHYYNGTSMRSIGHVIYVMRYLGIKKIVSIDDVGALNPRFANGEIALIYDHINLMGDNPLIGKNDNELGLRFPDMSNAYDKELYAKLYEVMQKEMVKINEAVYIGIIGPNSETDAEARFYRDIGGDVLGYSMVPENITAVHAGLQFAGIGLITRDLVADRMMEDTRSEEQKKKDQSDNRKKSLKVLNKVLNRITRKL